MMRQLKLFVVGASLALGTLLTGCHATAHSESTGQYIDNSAITAKVKAALIDAKDVPAGSIHVESYKGNVQLSGYVNNAVQKAKADAIARAIAGVTSVNNSLIIKGH